MEPQASKIKPEYGGLQSPKLQPPQSGDASTSGPDPEMTGGVHSNHQGPIKRVALSFHGISYSVKLKDGTTRQILNNVTGAVAPGEVLAIMGPSGSGKTSLLDTIAHRIRTEGSNLKGQVLFNGRREGPQGRRRIMSYVAQEDSLLGVFTVRETLWFAARFYYGYSYDNSQLTLKIEGLINAVGLRSAADTMVGNIFYKGLSGGQLRRLSVAVELISSPSVLLLDEPTSGLDSSSAYAIIGELKELAGFGHTIICTIHQPSSEIWARFDQFMLLAKGQTCYFGPATLAAPYFASIGYSCPTNFNPADFVINLVTTDFDSGMFKRPSSIEELSTAFENSQLKTFLNTRVAQGVHMQPAITMAAPSFTSQGTLTPTEVEEPSVVRAASPSGKDITLEATSLPTSGSTAVQPPSNTEDVPEEEPEKFTCRNCCVAGGGYAGFWANLRTLVHRNLLNVFRNPGILLVRELMYLMLALFLGLTFLYVGRTYTAQSVISRNSLLFFVAAFFVFMTVAVLPFIVEERAVFLREKRNGAYTVPPYVIAQFITMLPGTFLIASTTSLFIVFMVSLNGYGYYLLILWLSLVYAECFVYMIGALSPYYIVGIAIAAGFFGMCMIFEGFFIVFYEIGWYVRWIGYVTPHRYAFRAFMRNEWATIYMNTTMKDGSFYVLNGSSILDFYGYNDAYIQTIGGDLGILVAFAMAYLLMLYLVCEFYWT